MMKKLFLGISMFVGISANASISEFEFDLAEKLTKVESKNEISSMYLGTALGVMPYDDKGGYFIVDRLLEKAVSASNGSSSKIAGHLLEAYRLQRGFALRAKDLLEQTMTEKQIKSKFGEIDKANKNYWYTADPKETNTIKSASDFQSKIMDSRNTILEKLITSIRDNMDVLDEIPMYFFDSNNFRFNEEKGTSDYMSSQNCSISEARTDVLLFTDCGYLDLYRFDLNQVDLLNLRIQAGAALVMYGLDTMWDISGTETLMEIRKNLNLTTEDAVQILSLDENAGKFRVNTKPVEAMKRNLTELQSSINYIQTVADSAICDSRERDNFGINATWVCYPQFTQRQISPIVDSGLNENTAVFESSFDDEPDLHLNLGAILKNPIRNFKNKLPNKFNNCGEPTEMPDPSLGGFYPQNDALYRIFGERSCN